MTRDEILDASTAIMAAMLYEMGADEDNPIKVDQSFIIGAGKGKLVPIVAVNPAAPTEYLMYYKEG